MVPGNLPEGVPHFSYVEVFERYEAESLPNPRLEI
jgi:hypothetical protein